MSETSPDPVEAVLSLLSGAVPERKAEVECLWEKYAPGIMVSKSARGIVKLDATGERIAFAPKTIDLFWLIGFSGWRAIECYSPHVVCSSKMNLNLEDLFRTDYCLPRIERDYKERRAAVHALVAADDGTNIHWPPDLPRPTADRNALDCPQYKSAYDLTLLAFAFALFHEFRHVMLDVDDGRPTDRREEEMACDVWAREFMTAHVADYAKQHGHSYADVLRKRSMGLALAALVLHDITPEWGHGGSRQYPPLVDRLEAILGNTALSPDDPFWVFTASLLLGVFRQKGESIDTAPKNPRLLSEELVAKL